MRASLFARHLNLLSLILISSLWIAALPNFAMADSLADLFSADLVKSEIATTLLMKDLGLIDRSRASETHRALTSDGISDTVEVNLHQNLVGDIHLLVKGPHGFLDSGSRYITLLVASGIYTGKDSIALLSQLPNVILVGIDYPDTIQKVLKDPQTAFQFLRRTPGDIALSLEWLSRQSWVEARGPSALGVSLGGLFLPVALHMAQRLGVNVPRSIFAFTGADLVTIAANNLKDDVSSDMMPTVLRLISGLTYLDDPQMHLPFLRGNHLVVRADADLTIPSTSTDRLFELLNGSKQSVTLHGGHINSHTPELITGTENAILNWVGNGL